MGAAKVFDNIKVLIETAKYIIIGTLVTDDIDVKKYPTMDNILLYALNCGKKFISLKDCTISSKEEAEYQPEKIEYFHVNLDIVHTCRIFKG